MALISNGTTVASGGSVTVSSSAVASATASISADAVGSYALLKKADTSNYSRGDTTSGSLTFVSVVGDSSGYNLSASGTWRCMGHKIGQNVIAPQTTLWLRIS